MSVHTFQNDKKINLPSLARNLAFPLFCGLFAGFLSRSHFCAYETLQKPPFAAPAAVFPIIWTLLYLIMGISSYLLFQADRPYIADAFGIYLMQMFFNFIWPLVFFNLGNHLLAFILLAALWFAILQMINEFYAVSRAAALLQLPYLLFVTYAGYLNLGVVLLNKR